MSSIVAQETKPKILFCFFQTGDQSNGGVISLLKIATSLTKFTPVFLSQMRTRRTADLERQGFTVICIDQYNWRNTLSKPLSILFWNLAVMRIIRQNRISIVHVNDNRMVWRVIFAVKVMRVAWLTNIRDLFHSSRRYGWNRLWVNYSDRIIVLSKEMKKELLVRLPFFQSRRRAATFSDRISVIHSIVEVDGGLNPFDSSHDDLFKGAFDGHLVYVAAFNEKKNQLEFIRRALPKLKELNICVHFVGDFNFEQNPYARACKDSVELAGVSSHAKFHGFQTDIDRYYKNADLTIVPTRHEGLARCMIESMRCGTPVVSFDVCSAREILVDNECGIVVKQGDYNRLCNEVHTLLQNKSLLKRMSLNGVNAAIRLFNKAEIIRQYEDEYQKVQGL